MDVRVHRRPAPESVVGVVRPVQEHDVRAGRAHGPDRVQAAGQVGCVEEELGDHHQVDGALEGHVGERRAHVADVRTGSGTGAGQRDRLFGGVAGDEIVDPVAQCLRDQAGAAPRLPRAAVALVGEGGQQHGQLAPLVPGGLHVPGVAIGAVHRVEVRGVTGLTVHGRTYPQPAETCVAPPPGFARSSSRALLRLRTERPARS
jgi:hypothetical protein